MSRAARAPATQTHSATSKDGTSAADTPDTPPLSYRVLTADKDKQDALRLVADSIAQQRQVASAAVICHPLCLAVLAAMCAVTYHFFAHQGYGSLMTMFSGVGITYLSAARYFTSSYITTAEAFRWKSWIASGSGEEQQEEQEEEQEEDTVLAAIFGKEIIGTLVLRLRPEESRSSGGGKGIIRAWTCKLRYRGKGVGSDLLQLAVEVTHKRFGPGAAVEFAADHPNSVHPLHDMFNAPFRKRQEKAARALAHALEHKVDQ